MSRRPNFGGMGGMNMQQMMKQAKKLQAQMAEEQENITAQEFTGKSADDLVIATFSGDRQLKDLKINKEAIDPDDPDMLQDLIIDAVNKGGGATLGAHQYDTVYQTDRNGFLQQVLPRQYVISGASPEGFRLGDIYPIYKSASLDELEKMTSAGAIALAHNIPMKVIPTHILNLKITYPEDMILFQQLAEQYFFIEQDK